jgi:DNA-binding GntR family transcriptional regulator
LHDTIIADIVTGPGDLGRDAACQIAPRRAIPSKRTIAQEHGVATGTIDKALDLLRADGHLKTVCGLGLFVVAPEDRSPLP